MPDLLDPLDDIDKELDDLPDIDEVLLRPKLGLNLPDLEDIIIE